MRWLPKAAGLSTYARFSPKLNFEVSTNHGWGLVEDNAMQELRRHRHAGSALELVQRRYR
ncbi:MAG: hypothetical protein IPL91_11340 [Hyphomicrobium sp.]|nr:hypothetical protein [Hyphomicrobium sp.]